MRRQELDLEETTREIKKISRQVQALSDTCTRTGTDTYESLNQKRKIRSALDYSLVYLKRATKLVNDTVKKKQEDKPLLSKQSLTKVVRSGQNLEEVASYFGMGKKTISNTMRIFGITFPEKEEVEAS